MGREVVTVWRSGSQFQQGIAEEIVKWVLVVVVFLDAVLIMHHIYWQKFKMNAAQQRLW